MPARAYRLTTALMLTALLWLPVLSPSSAPPRAIAATGAALLPALV